jgi:hypothetical protein
MKTELGIAVVLAIPLDEREAISRGKHRFPCVMVLLNPSAAGEPK